MAKTAFELMREWNARRRSGLLPRAKDETPFTELRVFNPLSARLGDFLSLTGVVELVERGITRPEIREIDAITLTIGDSRFHYTDYAVYQDENTWALVRVKPVSNPSPNATKHSDMLAIFFDINGAYDESVEQELNKSEITLPTDGAVFTRIKDRQGPLSVYVEVVENSHKPFTVNNLLVWDFERTLPNGKKEFFFAEVNKENGFMQMWRAIEIPESAVHWIPAVRN